MKWPPFRYPLLWPITTNTHTNTDRYRWQAAEGYQAIPGGSGRRARTRARRVPARNRAAEGSVARQRERAQLLCQCLRGGESRPRFLSMISDLWDLDLDFGLGLTFVLRFCLGSQSLFLYLFMSLYLYSFYNLVILFFHSISFGYKFGYRHIHI